MPAVLTARIVGRTTTGYDRRDVANLDLSFLPAVNASLNGAATALLLVGFAMIRTRRVAAHKACMLSALAVSALFLVSYVTHYYWRAAATGEARTKLNAPQPWLALYLAMLISHILLAVAVPVLAIRLIQLAVTRRFDRHRRLAPRIALPIWLYVSITGVAIYVVLYHLNPPAP